MLAEVGAPRIFAHTVIHEHDEGEHDVDHEDGGHR